MSNVTPTRIIYSDEFKRYFLREHGKGRGVTEIFRNAGLPVLIIGGNRTLHRPVGPAGSLSSPMSKQYIPSPTTR